MKENDIDRLVAVDEDWSVARIIYGGNVLPRLVLLGEDRQVLLTESGLLREELFAAIEAALSG